MEDENDTGVNDMAASEAAFTQDVVVDNAESEEPEGMSVEVIE